MMTRGHLVAGIGFLAIAVFLGWHATRLTYYSSLGPGPGFFPVWLCVALGALSLGVVIGALRAGTARAPDGFWPERGGVIRILAVVLGLVLVALALRTLGFRLTMAVFACVVMLALGSRSVAQIAFVVLLASVGSYLLFVDGLGLALPVGTLGF